MTDCCEPIAGGLKPPEAAELAGLFKALADPARLMIVSMLANAEEVCVCDLTEPLGLSQPTVSHHVKQLRDAGFITSERRGKWIYHRLASEQLDAVRRAIAIPEPV
jgi:ArsR family transcriptional regulator